MHLDMDPNTRIYKVLDWIDNAARSLPLWTQVIMLTVVLESAFLISLWLTHITPILWQVSGDALRHRVGLGNSDAVS